MLFNSYEFILIFLPLTLAAFFMLGRLSRTWALRWIILVSLVFYAFWRPVNVLIIAPSVLVNFLLARLLERLGRQKRRDAARLVLLLGIAFNVAFLGYFKYANFFVESVNDALGTNLILARIILPLGISFITFQKIAFLVDVYSERIGSFTLQDYCLFVLFFPQLIAGPIVHYREMMPQFHRASCRLDRTDLSVGLTLFIFGLFKKVVLADGIAPLVTPIFDQAAAGGAISFLPAWMGAIGFTFQIYFDFSGYTDMALGLARFVGIRLPPNFNSPLRASSIIDFWLKWHMTLTRFLTAYIYNPLALALTRRRMARGRPGFTGRNATIGAFAELLLLPTLLTMFISGIWHGAGYLFILWGLVHGLYLIINHAWRQVAPRWWPNRDSYTRFMTPVGFVLTFAAVAAAMVLFRSATMTAAGEMLRGLVGLNGLALPASISSHFGPLEAWIHRVGVPTEASGALELDQLSGWILGLAVIVFCLPNTLQMLAAHEPALGVKPEPGGGGLGGWRLTWHASLAWAMALSVLAVVAINHLGGNSEFLYWQF
jgi:alginate O-acetyltransferase complex protein AlgI